MVLDCNVVMPSELAVNTKRQPQHKDVDHSCTIIVSVRHLYHYRMHLLRTWLLQLLELVLFRAPFQNNPTKAIMWRSLDCTAALPCSKLIYA